MGALQAVVKEAHPDFVEVNDVAAQVARTSAAALMTGASKTQKAVVASLVRRSLDQGWSEAVLRARIAEKVGLDPRSAQAVETYRSGLEKQGVAPGRRQRLVTAYAKRLRKHRARVIARTETQRALMDAQRLIWARMQQAGDISPYAVRVTVTHKDDRLCHVCRPEGGRRHSIKRAGGGPPFHPQCRCYEELVDQGIDKHHPVADTGGSMDHMEDVSKVSSRAYPSLERKKGGPDNWVEQVGGLPSYIERIAKHLHYERGMPIGRAIAVAVSRCKMWAAGGGGVEADTKAKAAKAIAEWEAKKARAHAKKDGD